jgi:hypothetical protein
MTIEISDIKYWKPLNYDDAILYCSLLEVDGYNNWRLFTTDEYITQASIIKEIIVNNPGILPSENIDMFCEDGLRLLPHMTDFIEDEEYDMDNLMTIPVRTA